MNKFIVPALSLVLLTSACANPVVAPPVTPADAQKSCRALEEDMRRTAALKKEARADDKFMFRYVFLLNAGVSAYRMNKAESAAAERLAELNRIAGAKGCLGGGQDKVIAPNTPVTPKAVLSPNAPPTPAPVVEPNTPATPQPVK